MKYFVRRESKYSHRIDIKRTKCTDHWCSEEYVKKNPDRVWQFSKQGAQGIADKGNEIYGWGYVYSIVPVDEILNERGMNNG